MNVRSISTDTLALAVTPIGDRLYRLACDTKVSVQTDEGVFLFEFLRGFTTNFRSGGVAVDSFIDQVGDERKSLCYLVHDAVYTPCDALGGEHPLSRIKGDEMLKAGLLWAGMGKFRAALVYNSVRLFGHDAYWDDDALTSYNSRRFAFGWRDR